jgi:N-acetyl sugar amidotransferase
MKACSRCVFDETLPNITFDSKGVCNYCKEFDNLEAEYPTGDAGWKKLLEIAEQVKKAGKHKKFDCVIGVSGGCDSSYLVYLAKEKLGLRPLAVHFDNTWNSKIAVENIHRVLNKLDIELYTYVMDNEEWSDLARAFLKASVPEIDSLTDIALVTAAYQACDKYGVKYIFDGHSFRTEGVGPLGWFYFDGKYIESVHKQYGTKKMEYFPNLRLLPWMKWLFKGIKRLRPLYYIDYNKEEVKKFLQEEFDWQWYSGHHMENRYTMFCDNYILPTKFHIDLRYVELAAFVRTGKMKRQEALEELKQPVPFDTAIIDEVKKRLNLTDEEFDEILKLPKKSFKDFQTYLPTFRRMKPFFWLMAKLNRVPKTFYIKYCK